MEIARDDSPLLERPDPPPPDPAGPGLRDRDEKNRLVEANRLRLEEDLWAGRLEYASRPALLDLQLSNFCNMSCIMCWDGANPALRKMSPALVETLEREALPHATSIEPFVGSEPLVVTWDLARDLARRHGLELDLVTNLQFLDEKKFHELEPHVSYIRFSIDSHLRDVYERIRLRSRPDLVFKNLPLAAKLCREHGIEAQVNVVFMVENAAYLDETVAFMADAGIPTVRILDYHSPHPGRDLSDPKRHLSREWIDRLRERIRKVAAEKRIRVIFEWDPIEILDHLPPGTRFRERPSHEAWVERLRRFYPGYCVQSAMRLKVNADGDSYPCCVGDGPTLRLGNLERQSFEDVWNGPEARDLRRGMMTDDVPGICRGCVHRDGWVLRPQGWMIFVDDAQARLGIGLDPLEGRRTIRLLGPDHLARTEVPPTLRWSPAPEPVDRYVVALAVGGEVHEANPTFEVDGRTTEFRVPDAEWRRLKPNMGYWWTVWGLRRGSDGFAANGSKAAVDTSSRAVRADEIRCLVRHVPIPRVAGSALYSTKSPHTPVPP
jgi:radical SAM protein with 4Fe4S-binding SPASM domain